MYTIKRQILSISLNECNTEMSLTKNFDCDLLDCLKIPDRKKRSRMKIFEQPEVDSIQTGTDPDNNL
jgi:hypothetical protein